MVVGLTGGIGSGKTVVSDMFAQLGVTVVDADVCARIVVEKGKPALVAIHEHFGDDVIDKNGELQRAALRQIIFSQPAEKIWLESLLHPVIFQEMLSQLQHATSPYAILVSPLLVETGQTTLCNRILVVDAPETLQLSRTMLRDNNSSDQVNAIMANQSARETRLAHADDVLVNDGDLQTLAERVLNLHRHLLNLV
jgi:dephospho-CoA kinase